jgi:hypothetical protein
VSRYTRLESAVLEALAHELRDQVPDLAGQVAASRLSQRRNSGFGLFTEVVPDQNRPLPVAGLTGDLGTVHAMVGSLPDPIAFKARVRNGVLLGLFGDSYGQDTRALDFATVPFRQVFTVDAQGRSIAFEPTGSSRPAAPESPKYRPVDRPAPARPAPVAVRSAPAPVRDPAPPRKAEKPAPPVKVAGLLGDPRIDQAFDRFAKQAFGDGPANAAPMSKDEKTGLRVFLWTGLFALGAILVLVFKMSPVFVFVAGMVIGRFLQTDSGLSALKRGADEIRKAQAKSS